MAPDRRVRGARAALRIGGVVLGVTLAGLVLMASFVDRLIFLPPPPSYGADAPGLLRLATTAGDTVAAIEQLVEGATLAVVHFHGNAEDAGQLESVMDGWAGLGVTVLAVDYPGYGQSSGRPTESGAYAAAEAALEHLEDRGYPVGRVVLHGRSLGGAVAVDAAARHPVAGLILESTFTSAFQVVLPLAGLPGDRFSSLAKLRTVVAPTFVIHGTRDEVVPFAHGERLFEALRPEQRDSWWVEGAGHNDLAWVAGEGYWGRLAGFLARIGDGGGRGS